MNVRLRRNARRVLIGIGLALAAVLFLGSVAFIVPTEYRVGPWRSLPQLDHRLIPHVSAVFAAAFGAFFGSYLHSVWVEFGNAVIGVRSSMVH
jgi:hypothetical protein